MRFPGLHACCLFSQCDLANLLRPFLSQEQGVNLSVVEHWEPLGTAASCGQNSESCRKILWTGSCHCIPSSLMLHLWWEWLSFVEPCWTIDDRSIDVCSFVTICDYSDCTFPLFLYLMEGLTDGQQAGQRNRGLCGQNSDTQHLFRLLQWKCCLFPWFWSLPVIWAAAPCRTFLIISLPALQRQDEDEPATQALDEDDVVIMRTYGHGPRFSMALTAMAWLCISQMNLEVAQHCLRRWSVCGAY